jgi:hypothetical protein
MLLSFLALRGLAVGKFARMLVSFLFLGRDSIDANATVLFNLLWRNLEEALMKKGCFSASCFSLIVRAEENTKLQTEQKQTHCL